jgi:hypothetical protein
MNLADAITVIVPCPLANNMAHRDVVPPHLRKMMITSPFVGVAPCSGDGVRLDHPFQRRAIGVVFNVPPHRPALPTDHAADRGTVVVPRAVALKLVAAAARRIVRIAVRNAFFPPRFDTAHRPPPRRRSRPLGPQRGRSGLARDGATAAIPRGHIAVREPVQQWARPARTRARSGPIAALTASSRAGPSR